MAAAKQQPTRAGIRRWIRRGIILAALLCAFLVSATVGAVIAALPVLPKIEGSEAFRQYEGRIYARDGKTVLRTLRAPTSRRYARARDIPDVLADAVVAIEDRRFYQHIGIDVRGIARAARADLRAGGVVEGGSTITQQLVKNAYLGPQRSVGRKTREALLAMALEARWSKDRILRAYLNTAYFGHGAYGVRDAARTYFGKEVRRVSLSEAALLAGLLQAPGTDDPIIAPQRARARRNAVLDAMRDLDLAEAPAIARARRAPLPTARTSRRATSELAPHFVDGVTGQLIQRYGVARALGGGLRVTTTLDPRLQRAARAAATTVDGTGLSIAIVALRPARGEVVALALGGPAARGSFDVASNGQRQPGSAFKPFTLAAAFEQGIAPSTKFLSAPYEVEPGTTITNDSGSYAGRIPLDQATWNSDNTVFARVAERVGIDPVIAAARGAGITAELPRGAATVLGGLPHGVSPLELASAYGTFAAHGFHATGPGNTPPRIRVVRTRSGTTLLRARRSGTRSLPRPIADLVTSTLTGVIERGTGTRAAIGRPAAGKTGTTEHNADAWFVGYTPDLVTAVWVGHPEGSVPMTSEFAGGAVSGGSFPAIAWQRFMRAATDGRPVRDFDLRTPTYVEVLVDRETGLLADVWCARAERQRFLEGHEPTRSSTDCPERTRPAPAVVGLELEAAREQLDAAGFEVEIRETFGTAAEQGRVIDQLPEAGEAVERDEPIRLDVATRE